MENDLEIWNKDSAKADEQVHVDEIRKQRLIMQWLMKWKAENANDTTKYFVSINFGTWINCFAVYGVLICLGIIFIAGIAIYRLDWIKMWDDYCMYGWSR